MSNKNQDGNGNQGWSIITFPDPKATVIEFVILLVLGLIIYGIWHLYDPPSPPLSPQAAEIQESTLKQISDIQRQVANQQQELTQEQVDNLEKEVRKWQSDLDIFLEENLTERSKEVNQILEEIPLDLSNIITSENKEEQENILSDVEKNLVNLKKILKERNLFWSGNKKWIEVIFWTLFGTLLYLIQQTAEYKLRVDNKTKKRNNDQQNQENQREYSQNNNGGRADDYLQRHKPQYYSYLLRSPFISLSILWVLTAANFNIAGFTLLLSDINVKVLVSLAFILGYFNRVAISQLNLIVSAIFKDAWNQTVRNIDIDPSYKVVKYGGSYNFNAIPDVKVTWSILSQPKVGTIDTATGMFIAPPQPGYYCEINGEGQLEWKQFEEETEEEKKNHRQVIIRAVREDESSISTIALVTLIENK